MHYEALLFSLHHSFASNHLTETAPKIGLVAHFNLSLVARFIYIWNHLNLQEILITFHNAVNAAIYPVSC